MFNPSRDQARRFFVDAWKKRREAQPLTPLETLAADLVAQHPEYHALLEDGDAALAREWSPAQGESNPVLHLSLHLAIEEQLAIGQPFGITEAFEALTHACGGDHEARHVLVECLGETVWRAQREGGAPDAQAYLDCAHARAAAR